ncbi:unnamed protein product [Mytilus edulis]|uniref:Uncharacterized protein n=1 Tax=Mytilus edulis TaxID=6550 RepID=A0A8S3R1A3_MYTED|nr:unnamed protein product [Mytilus edulis]
MQYLKKLYMAVDFPSFIRMVKANKYPFENISLRLFFGTVSFMSKRITSELWYRGTTKRFWKIGYRLFHGKFLYFMGGPKSIAYITGNLYERGMGDPQDAGINFAVPSLKILSYLIAIYIYIPKCDLIAMDLDIPKGSRYIGSNVLQAFFILRNQHNYEFMLCADGFEDGINSRKEKHYEKTK